MLGHVVRSNLNIRATTCVCSHSCNIQIPLHRRQTTSRSRSTQLSKSLSSTTKIQTSQYFNVLNTTSTPLSQTTTHARTIPARRVICLQHRHNSQYVTGARYLEKLKENDEFCEEVLRKGQFAVFYDLRALVKADENSNRMKLVWRGADEMNEVLELVEGMDLTNAVLLNSTGKDPSQPGKFALNIPKADDATQQSLEEVMEAETIGIRRALFSFGRGDIHELLQAYALLQWHSLQVFCSKCGAKNTKNMAGNRRICSSCSEVHYPTMKPIVITLVTNGDKCLVARQPQFPPGMYSALAGFCDMGETLEDAVRREVAEEVGLEVEDITYYSSQHWPIPSSGLMLGCHATAKANDQILIDKNELEDAKWMERQEVQSILQQSPGQSSPWFPPRSAIAHHLISGWAFKK